MAEQQMLRGTVQLFALGGTKLIRREAPPQNDALTYGVADGNGEFLGYVVSHIGVPKWMSSHFADVLAEQSDPGAKLDSYSEDWTEKIIYVPKGDPMLNEDIEGKTQADDAILFSEAMQHQLSTGCNQMSPRTTVQALSFKKNEPKPDPYYAVVSLSGDDPTKMAEITITELQNRDKFVQSAMHKNRLSVCLTLRANNSDLQDLLHRRLRAFQAIRSLPDTFKP